MVSVSNPAGMFFFSRFIYKQSYVFESFLFSHNKSYIDEELKMRLFIFNWILKYFPRIFSNIILSL
jgi:hypothetical protein